MTILSDTEIKEKIRNGELIINGKQENVGPSCYELRMGTIYYDLIFSTIDALYLNNKEGRENLIEELTSRFNTLSDKH